MDFEKYTAGVLRTASPRFEGEHVAIELFRHTLSAFAYVAEAVDTIRRAFYYGKGFDSAKFLTAVREARAGLWEVESAMLRGVARSRDAYRVNWMLMHGVLGIACESGELVEALLYAVDEPEDGFDWVNLHEECGDVMYYVALTLAEARDITDDDQFTLSEVLHRNQAKLKRRYPDAFAVDCANNRDLDAERAVLEGDGIDDVTNEDLALTGMVSCFAALMSEKLRQKRREGYHGWDDRENFPDAGLVEALKKHVEKGDWVDVANFAAMLHERQKDGPSFIAGPEVPDEPVS